MVPEVRERENDYQPSYEMAPEDVRQLCSEFISGQENRPSTKFACYLISNETKYSNLGRYVEGTVFNKTFGNSPKVMHDEYGPYEDASTFFVVIDQEASLPVGVMRIIENSEAGLKSLVDLEKTPLAISTEDVCMAYDINLDRCADLGTLAVLPEYRGSTADFVPASLAYRTLYLTVLNNPRFDHVVTVIDENALRNLNFFKFPFRPIFDSEGFSYLDSPKSYAMFAKNSSFYPQVRHWVSRLKKEAQESGSDRKLWQASTMDSFINGGPIDQMLGFNKDNHLLITRTSPIE